VGMREEFEAITAKSGIVLGELEIAFTQMFNLYGKLIAGGFTEDQALTIIQKIITSKPDSDPFAE
jgi:hypothetical protein